MKSIFFILCLLVLQYASAATHVDYGIMIDAGSSGSRIYLYQWDHRDDPSLPLVQPTTINQVVVSHKISTPLASFASNPSNAGESLTDLIDYIKKNLDKSRYADTPIYLKATAGMRAISVADQDNIIADVRQYLHTTPFEFKDDYAKVIPGTDEGVFGWITVNYLLNILVQTNPTAYGALDMGGASTQITFTPTSKPSQYAFTSTLNSHTYDLYTYSYPLGQDQSNREVIAGLLADGFVDADQNIINPCYLSGYNETYAPTGKLVFGTSNYAACQIAVRKYLIQANSSCTECAMRSVYQPALNGKFYAFSAFAYTYAFFNLSNTASVNQLSAAGQAFCAKTFSQAKAANPSDSFLKQYCFSSTYFTELLLTYGFSADTSNLIVQANVGSTEVTWALGGMIYEANLLPIGHDSAASSILAGSVAIFFVLLSML